MSHNVKRTLYEQRQAQRAGVDVRRSTMGAAGASARNDHRRAAATLQMEARGEAKDLVEQARKHLQRQRMMDESYWCVGGGGGEEEAEGGGEGGRGGVGAGGEAVAEGEGGGGGAPTPAAAAAAAAADAAALTALLASVARRKGGVGETLIAGLDSGAFVGSAQ